MNEHFDEEAINIHLNLEEDHDSEEAKEYDKKIKELAYIPKDKAFIDGDDYL